MRDALFKAVQANSGAVMKKRFQMVEVIETMVNANSAGIREICQFFLKLRPGCQQQCTAAKRRIGFFYRFQI